MRFRVGSPLSILAVSVLLFVIGSAGAQQQLSLMDRVEVIDGPLNVRSIPGTTNQAAGQQESGALGTIADASPHYVGGFWWWFVDFDEGADGWVAEGANGVPYIARRSPQGAAAGAAASAADDEAPAAAPEDSLETARTDGQQHSPQTSRAAAAGPLSFDATWEGMVVRDSGYTSLTYPIEIRLGSMQEVGAWLGEVAYERSADCEYSLVLDSAQGNTISATRSSSGDCGDAVVFTMELTNVELEFLTDTARSYRLSEPHMLLSYTSGTSKYQATLFRSENNGMLRSQDRRRRELYDAFTGEANPRILEGVPIACGNQTYDGARARAAWTGDCVGGLISGIGRLELRGSDGLYRWSIDITEENGLALENGVITVALDESDFTFTCGDSHIWGQVSEEIALYDSRIANRLLAIGAGIHENEPCFVGKGAMAGMAATVAIRVSNYAPKFDFRLTMIEGRLRNGVPYSPDNEFAKAKNRVHATRRADEQKAAEEAAREERRAQERAAAQALSDSSRAKRQGFLAQYRATSALDRDCEWTFNPFELDGQTVVLAGAAIEMLSATSANFSVGYPTTSQGIWFNTYIAGFGWCNEAVTIADLPRATFEREALYYVAARVTEIRNGRLYLSYLGSLACQEEDCVDFRRP